MILRNMFILKKGHQPGVYVPLRALFLVMLDFNCLRGSGNIISYAAELCFDND